MTTRYNVRRGDNLDEIIGDLPGPDYLIPGMTFRFPLRELSGPDLMEFVSMDVIARYHLPGRMQETCFNSRELGRETLRKISGFREAGALVLRQNGIS